MARSVKSQGKARFVPAALAVAGLSLAIPAAGLAVVQTSAAAELPETVSYLRFTPAKVDPQLAARVAAVMGEDGLRFTPANKPVLTKDRTVTVAVRVDDAMARAISVRSAIDSAGTADSRERVLAISQTSYNLGVARGYQSFAQPAKPATVSVGLRDMGMPDLASYALDKGDKPAKPGRFDSRLALEKEDKAGRRQPERRSQHLLPRGRQSQRDRRCPPVERQQPACTADRRARGRPGRLRRHARQLLSRLPPENTIASQRRLALGLGVRHVAGLGSPQR